MCRPHVDIPADARKNDVWSNKGIYLEVKSISCKRLAVTFEIAHNKILVLQIIERRFGVL